MTGKIRHQDSNAKNELKKCNLLFKNIHILSIESKITLPICELLDPIKYKIW